MDFVTLVFLGMLIPANGFPLLYVTFYRWWSQPIGRALMTKAIGLAIVIDVSVLRLIMGDEYPGRVVVRNVAFVLVLCGLWYQFVVFIRIRREARRQSNPLTPL